MKRLWPFLLLALLPLVPLWRAVFTGEAIGAFDEIRTMAPWNEQPTGRPWDVLQADSVLQFTVWRDLVFESWRSFELPLWNPYQLCGTPLLANSQSGGLYPPHILVGVLRLPTMLGMTLLAWAHLAWAGLGVFLLCRRLGASQVGGVVGGASFALSQFMLAWVGLPSVIQTCAWIPWILLSIEALFTEEERKGWIAALGACVGMMLLAGHLQFSAYGLLAAVLLAVWRGVAGLASKPWPRLAGVGAACVLGAAFAAPQLGQVLTLGKTSHRQASATEEGYRAYVAGGIPTYALVGLANPALQGLPTQASPFVDGTSNYWPALSHRGANFAETAVGLGPLVLLLLVLGAFRVRALGRSAPYAALGLLSLLLALGTPINRLFYFWAPGWSATGSPGRIVVLFVLAACIIAGCTLRERTDGEAYVLSRRAGILGIAAFMFLALAPFGWMRHLSDGLLPWLPNVSPDVLSKVVDGAAGAATGPYLLSILICVMVAVLMVSPSPWRDRVLVAAACVVPIALYAALVVRTSSGALPSVAEIKQGERVAAVNESWDLLAAAPAVLPPNTASLLRVHDIGGYDSLIDRETVEILRQIDGQDPAPPANGNIMFVKRSANPIFLAEAGVSEVWSRRPMDKIGTLAHEEDGLFKYRLPGPGRAYVETAAGDRVPAEIEQRGLSGLRVRTRAVGKLVVKDRAFPGWRAKHSGRTHAVEPGRWIVVSDVPADTVVDLEYRPPGLTIQLVLMALGGAGLVGLACLGKRAPAT